MSTFPFWLLSFDLREDVETQVLEVLTAVGLGQDPDPVDLDRVPPVPRYYLEQPRRMQRDQVEPGVGTPVRLARSSTTGLLTLTIEFAQHDDEFANGGWRFWLWVLSLAHRPSQVEGRHVLGLHGLYRGDAESHVIQIDAEGVTEDGQLTRFAELDEALDDEAGEGFWS